jgi:hypothetical protein
MSAGKKTASLFGLSKQEEEAASALFVRAGRVIYCSHAKGRAGFDEYDDMQNSHLNC